MNKLLDFITRALFLKNKQERDYIVGLQQNIVNMKFNHNIFKVSNKNFRCPEDERGRR